MMTVGCIKLLIFNEDLDYHDKVLKSSVGLMLVMILIFKSLLNLSFISLDT